jgi:hypothetical protein
MAVITIAALISAPFSFAADEKLGIFEVIHASSVSFDETAAAVESALARSGLVLHATHDVRIPEDKHRARVYVMTSLAVYTSGEDQKTYINMANPVAHAMVFYVDSKNYDALIAAARNVSGEMRQLVADVPGEAMAEQQEPLRSEKHYNKYKGDGPARMMAKFRTFEKSQLLITEDTAENFDSVVENVKKALSSSSVSGIDESTGWEQVAAIKLRDDAVYIGVTNPYIEDKMVRINSRFRSEGKSDESPYPGVDHVTALPTDILVIKDAGETLVLHYGQMWRMQLYFWDSGYRAFTANVGVPSAIANSIEATLRAE